MEIIINNQTKTEALKAKFQETYPFLKLEFFTTVHAPGKATPERFKIGYDRRIGQNSETGTKKEFVIHPDMTIAELEQGIEKLFGIGLQVLRKSGPVWLETVATDDWTIREQNTEARLLSRSVPPEPPMDYQEQE